jgi:acyl-[acyl-carrier-protein]-phospholipid O-acyltransferase/long-chain-fatty-acid--[acyl-carrier-protein] ligase
MLGYMRATSPGQIEKLEDGWYDTGDIVDLDAEGYVTIKGRAKRFAKIAGEMVSMTAAEALVCSLWPDDQHAVINLPDSRKGERLLLVTTRQAANVSAILAHGRERGIPEIMVPRDLMVVETMPLLATGKLDYPSIETLVAAAPKGERTAEISTPLQSPGPLVQA